MSDEQREMTLEEWCDRLPASHRVNRELQDLKQREAELVEALEELEDKDYPITNPQQPALRAYLLKPTAS
jgi:hypothetical protein